MKNRLQIKYHIPESLPTRTQAMKYLQDTFAIGQTNNTNTSLPAEPLVILYNNTPLDIANGITELERLKTSNALLAIGRGGDGKNILNNQNYFVIDFAKHDEEIADIIQKYTTADNELSNLISEIQISVSEIKNSINEEKQLRENSDNELSMNLQNEVDRAINAENVISKNLMDEITRSIEKDGNLEASDTALNIKINDEIARAINKENELNTAINTVANNVNVNTMSINTNKKDIAKNQIKTEYKTININTLKDDGTYVDVNIDGKTIVHNDLGILSVKVNPNDKILTNNDNGINTTLSLKWLKDENSKEKIQLLGKDNIVISTIEIDSFLKDGMIENVELLTIGENAPKLRFTFNSSAGKNIIDVPVKDLVDVYNAGNGLLLNENVFSIKISEDSEKFLDVSVNGIKLSGIQNSIDAAKNEVTNRIENESLNRVNDVKRIDENILLVNNNITNESNERKSAIQKIETDFKMADDNLKSTIKTEYETADTLIRTDFTNADNALLAGYTNAVSNLKNELTSYVNTISGITKENITANKTELNNLITAEQNARESADAVIRNDFSLADATLQGNITTEVTARENADKILDNKIESITTDYLKNADKIELNNLIAEERNRAQQTESNLQQTINILNGGVNDDGSIKHMLNDAVIASTVSYITPEDANSQTLLRKYLDNNTSKFYASNNTKDMMHDGKVLNNFINELTSSAHTHSNKTVIDKITDTNIINWDNAKSEAIAHADALINTLETKVVKLEESAHTHSNKTVIDNITNTEIRDWNDAVLAKHTHTNKTVLDEITSTKIEKWESNLQNAKDYADNKFVAKEYANEMYATKTDIANFVTLETLTNKLEVLINKIGVLEGKVDNCIQYIEGTGGEISVYKTGNKATVAFDPDAEFDASLEEE